MKQYAHHCRMQHPWIGHSDSVHEQCPLCRAMDLLRDACDYFYDDQQPWYKSAEEFLEELDPSPFV